MSTDSAAPARPASVSPETAPSASLSYFIFERLLTGTAGGRRIHVPALSGGGGGSKVNPPNDDTNNPYSLGVRTGVGASGKHVHGGPLPLGRYTIKPPARHPRLGLSARLEPTGQPMLGRAGFLIHGRGPHGSDGCIVPVSPADFQPLMDALAASRGGILYVEEAMGGWRFG